MASGKIGRKRVNCDTFIIQVEKIEESGPKHCYYQRETLETGAKEALWMPQGGSEEHGWHGQKGKRETEQKGAVKIMGEKKGGVVLFRSFERFPPEMDGVLI